jgi:CheY-like chemotaxis protein
MITLNLPPPPSLMPVPGMVNPQHPQYDRLNPQNVASAPPPCHSVTAAPERQAEAEPQAPRTGALPATDDSSNLAWGVLILFAGIFAFHNLAPRIGRFLNSRSDPWAGMSVAATDASSQALAEHQSLSNFKDAFGGVPTGTVTQAEPGGKKDDSKPRSDLLNEVLDRTLKDLAIVRTFVSAIGRCSDESSRQKLLAGLSSEISTFKRKVNQPELLPIWQMAAALEGLLQQLTATPAHLTASTLRTVGSAVALLEALCIPGLKPDLASNPPVRFLAVDDDAISRRAVSSALKKALTEPDLAEGGEAALALAAQKSYDVIFLDVEMPGMDGFELCSKIHETELNRTTPVVFVTGHSDFKARAKSASTGGEDLIGKPFLAFELTVKALMLTLRERLRTCEAAVQPAAQTVKGPHSRIVKDLSSTTPENHSQKSEDKKRSPTVPTVSLPPMPNHKNGVAAKNASRPAPAPLPAGPMPGDRNLSNGTAASRAPLDPFASEPSAAEFAQAFFTHAPIHLEELQNQLQMARNAPKPTDLSEFLGELYVGIHSLKADAERAELLALSRLSCSLEGMLKKLLESPKLCTPSTLDTAATAFELLVKLCRARSNPDLTRTPIHLLVVDDDPMARRAIGGALQLVFGKPESADSGEAALALAAEKPFDLIFLDVMMPGIDGFAACPKIHETGPNGQTPVVFVTSSDNQKSRSQAAGAGGCGFIPKPVLPSQITLTAWTFVLGNRLEKLKPAHVATQIEAALV